MPDRRPDVKKSLGKSKIEFRRLPGDRVRVSVRLVHKSARYDLDCVIDSRPQRVGPIRQRLSCGSGLVFDAITSLGAKSGRTECTFGNATEGVRSLSTVSQPLGQGTVVGGYADGVELVSMVVPDCSCEQMHPTLLAWNADGSARPVQVGFKAHNSISDIKGLKDVLGTAIARVNDGRFGTTFGDIGTCIDIGLCMVGCIYAVFVCVEIIISLPDPPLKSLAICPSQIFNCFDRCIGKGSPS